MSAGALDAEHFRARVLQSAIDEGLAATCERRAAAFEDARPRPTDYRGHSTAEDLSRRWRELTEIANAWRARAALARMNADIDPDVWEAIAC